MWSITGVCLMPTDKALVDSLRQQECLYTLRESAAKGESRTQVVNSISSILYGADDREEILHRLSNPDTKVVSLTITEGGYDTAQALSEIGAGTPPTTVFGYLVHALARRKAAGHGGLVLLSCDNIQENGEVLRNALGDCLEQFDPALKYWVTQNVFFPNSMVDRITPASTIVDLEAFERQYGLRDGALVVCEDYFQWVLEDTVKPHLPPIDSYGVEFVTDVRPYEFMKLSVLNAGHSLVGFLGDALGYGTIHEAVVDPLVAAVFDRYALSEAIPVLRPLPGLNYASYYQSVKSRFSNAMINDSTARIIGGSSDKIPKFLLPIVREQLSRPAPQVDAAALVVAAWWLYLRGVAQRNAWDGLQDTKTDVLRDIFTEESGSAGRLLAYEPVFGRLATEERFASRYFEFVRAWAQDPADLVLKKFLSNDND